MKKSLLAVALVSILGVSAAIAATDNEAVKQKVEQLKSEFSLNDTQATRIQNILTRTSMTDEERKAAMETRMAAQMEKHMDSLKGQLGLDDEQVTKLKALNTAQMEKMKALRDEHKTEMATILTPEQMTKMQEMRGSGDGRMGRGGKGHGGKGRGGERHGRGGHQCDGEKAPE